VLLGTSKLEKSDPFHQLLSSENAGTLVSDSGTLMPTIHDLPVEFLTDNLLPFLPIRDLLALSGTSRSFANV
jgi:hypothetical protein